MVYHVGLVEHFRPSLVAKFAACLQHEFPADLVTVIVILAQPPQHAVDVIQLIGRYAGADIRAFHQQGGGAVIVVFNSDNSGTWQAGDIREVNHRPTPG